MVYRLLLPEQKRAIAAHTRDWLTQLRDEHAEQVNMKNALQILVGLWICEKALLEDKTFVQTRQQAQTIRHYLTSGSIGFTDLLKADAALVLLSTGILRALTQPATGLETFAEKISEILQQQESSEEANDLFMLRFLLYRLHFQSSLPAQQVRERSVHDLIHANDADMRSLATDIMAATRYGQLSLPLKADTLQALQSILPILVIHQFQRYNLEMGMQLLRCMNYLHLEHSQSFCTSLHYMLTQQHPEGKFGFLAHEIEQLPSLQQTSMYDLHIYLPLTVSFLWTVAEATQPHFVLVQSF